MATNSEDGDSDPTGAPDKWSDADREAAIAIEQRCGITLVPDGVDD
jgi:hypothetical protein